MADDTNVPNNQTSGSGEAQQALDDLTVLQNVQNQNLGDSRLNVARPTDVSDTSIGNLANVQQGSTSAPQVQSLGGIAGGVNVSLDVAIESAQSGGIAPPELGSAPVSPTSDGGTVAVNVGGAKALNVQAQVDLGHADTNAQTQDAGLGQPVNLGTPAGFAPTNAPVGGVQAPPPAAAAPPTTQTTQQTTAVNHDPTLAVDATAKSGHGTISGTISAGDIDGDTVTVSLVGGSGGALSVTDANGHAAGTVTLSADGHGYIFTPNADWQGGEQVSFQVEASDGRGGTAFQTITLTEVDANAPTITAPDNGAHGTISGTITTADADGDAVKLSLTGADATGSLSVTDTQGHAAGSVTLAADGSYTFTPNANWQGGEQIQFQVQADDGHGKVTSQTVTLTEVNSAPVLSAAQTTVTSDNHVQLGGSVSATDANAGDTVVFHLVDSHGNQVDSLATTHGSVTIDSATGEYTFVPTANATITADQPLTDSFKVVAVDNHGGTSGAETVNVTITNDGPSFTSHDNAATTDVAATSGHVAASDANAGDTVSYHLQTADGSLVTSVTTDHGTVHIDPTTGEYTFTPSQATSAMGVGDVATDSFKVVATDNHGASSAPTAVNVTITGTNDAPTISAAVDATASDHAGLTAGHVTGHDVNVHDTLSYSFGSDANHNAITSLATDHGTVNIDPSSGQFTFTPNTAAAALGDGVKVSDSFTVTVSDGHGGTATQTVAVDITGTNDAPTVSVANVTTADDHTAVTGHATGADVDSGDTVSYSLVDASGNHVTSLDTSHGHVSIDAATGNYTFTPSNDSTLGVGQTLGDSFKVVATDNHGASSAVQTVGVTITGSEQAPVAVDDTTIDTYAQAPGLTVSLGSAVTSSVAATHDFTVSGVSDLTVTTTSTATGNSAISGTSGNDLIHVTGSANGDINLGSGDDHLLIDGSTNYGATVETGAGNDTVKILGSANAEVDLGAGDNSLQIGGSNNYSANIEAGSGNDTVKIGGAANAEINLGDGNNAIDIGGSNNYGATIQTGSGNDTVKIGGDANAEIDLGDGNNRLSVNGSLNYGANVETGSGNDSVLINGSANASVGLGSGDDQLEVRGNLNYGATLDGGSGNDYIHVTGNTSSNVLGGAGNDTLRVDGAVYYGATIDGGSGNDNVYVGGSVWGSVDGGSGTDSIELGGYTKADWLANRDGIQSHVTNFENIKFSDGQVIGDATAFNTGTTVYKTPLTIQATLNDHDGSETLSPVTIGNVPAGASLELNGTALTPNADGTFTVSVTSGQPLTLNLVTSSAVDGSSLGLTTSVSSTESDGGAVAVTTVVGVGSNAGQTTADNTIHTNEDKSLTLKASDLLANDHDADGDTLSVTAVSNATHGSVTLGTDGKIVFTPDADYHGNATFQYTVSDGHGGTAQATVTVRVDSVNDAPVFAGTTATINGTESTSSAATVVSGKVTATDVDGDTLTYSVVSDTQAHHGTLAVDAATGNLTYTATDNNWSGSDNFSVKVSDGHGGTATETVNVNVAGAADAATVSLQVGAATAHSASFSVTNLDHLSSAGYSNSYGYYVMDANGNPTTGQIVFANAHSEDNVAKTITGVDQSHVGFFLIPNGHSDNSSLADGTNVTFSKDSSGNWQAVDSAGHVLSGDGAKVLFDKGSLNGDGVTHVTDNSVGGNQNWEDLNGGGDRDYNDVNMNVVWNTTASTTTHALTVAASFPDMDGSEAHSVSITGLPAGATLYQDGVALTATNGAYSIDPTHLTGLTVSTPAGFHDPFNLTVTAISSENGTTATSTATASINDDHAPVFDAAHSTLSLNVDNSHVNTANMGQLAATDADGDTLTYSVLADNATHHGSLHVDATSGAFFYDNTDTSFSGKDSFTVQVSDGHGDTTTQSVTMNVTGGANNTVGASPGHAIGWGDGGGRSESWGANGSWEVGGTDNHGHTTAVTTDGHWGSSWSAWDSGNPGGAGTGDIFSISGYNQHNAVYNGNAGDTLIGASGTDYLSLDNGSGKQMISGYDHIQMGDGDNAVVDLTTPRLDYGNVTVAGGSGHDVIWSASGNDLLVAGNGTTTIHAGAGNDTVVAGAGDASLMGQDGSDTFIFDFGHGHATVDGGAGAQWTDVVDLATNMHAGATISITTADSHSWTVVSDGTHQAHGTIELGQDKGGDITIHSTQGDETVHFTNIEAIKY